MSEKKKETNNLTFWESVEKTNPKHTKKAKIGQLDITAINATRQVKEATSKWGMFGSTWGIRDISYEFMDIGDTKLALVGCEFFYPEGSFPLHTSIKVCYMTRGHSSYLKIDDDFMKKAETDMLTKALSKLGFNSDIFMGLYDDNKYLTDITREFSAKEVVDSDSAKPKSIAKKVLTKRQFDAVKAKFEADKLPPKSEIDKTRKWIIGFEDNDLRKELINFIKSKVDGSKK